MLIDRRQLLVGGATITGVSVAGLTEAEALNLGKILGSVVRGVGYALKPVETLVKTSVHTLETGIKLAEQTVERTAELIAKTQQMSAQFIENTMKYAVQHPEMILPMIINPGYGVVSSTIFTQMASRAFHIGSSDDDHLRQDPSSFLNQQSAKILDYIRTFPSELIPHGVTLQGGGMSYTPLNAGGLNQNGFFPATLSAAKNASGLINTDQNLVTLLARLG